MYVCIYIYIYIYIYMHTVLYSETSPGVVLVVLALIFVVPGVVVVAIEVAASRYCHYY